MMTLQLFVPLVVILLSDAAPSKIEVRCAYNQSNFCWHAKQAYQQAKLVEGNLTDPKFREDKERASKLERTILTVLKKKEKSALLEPLRKGLDQSMNALFQLNVSCSGKRRVQPCKESLIALFIVTQDLAKAITIITPAGNQLDTMKKAEEVYNTLIIRSRSGVDIGYTFGRAVLNALENKRK